MYILQTICNAEIHKWSPVNNLGVYILHQINGRWIDIRSIIYTAPEIELVFFPTINAALSLFFFKISVTR